MRRRRQSGRQSGLTLVELIVAFTLLLTLTAMSVPLARYKVRREREKQLVLALREIRGAIDKYKEMCDAQKFGPPKLGSDCYPEQLEALVDGVKLANEVDKKMKFLRRMPVDPFTGHREWGKRAMQDDPKSQSWGGQHVFDVYSKTTEKAPDGTPYAEW
jgi:general secretion pathway protein G